MKKYKKYKRNYIEKIDRKNSVKRERRCLMDKGNGGRNWRKKIYNKLSDKLERGGVEK